MTLARRTSVIIPALTQSHVTNSSVLLIALSAVILLIGLVSEQISRLKFEGRKT